MAVKIEEERDEIAPQATRKVLENASGRWRNSGRQTLISGNALFQTLISAGATTGTLFVETLIGAGAFSGNAISNEMEPGTFGY